MLGTEETTSYWIGRSDAAWIDTYWHSVDLPHRAAILAAIRGLGRWRSLLEVGCHAGANLRLIAGEYPQAVLTGLDPNAHVIAEARRRLPAVTFGHGDLRGPERLPEHDVVLACYCLAYLPPESLPAALERLLGAARQALIIAEPMWGGPLGPIPEDPHTAWRHDYVTALRAVGAPGRLIGKRLPAVDQLDGLLVYTP